MRLDAACLAMALLALGCRREERPLETNGQEDPYAGNAWGISQGQALFSAMNCQSCHHYGGGMGPPLTDGAWLYGGDARALHSSIAHGRPNGMPAFGARLSDDQIWQLVAFVRASAALEPKDAIGTRSDHMSVRSPMSRQDPDPPGHTEVPSDFNGGLPR